LLEKGWYPVQDFNLGLPVCKAGTLSGLS